MKYFVLATLFFWCNVASAAVLINEIAWMGTTADGGSSNEWIELSNSSSGNIDLSGWVLRIEGKKDILLSGSVSANGYYLIERTDDNTLPSVTADLVASFGTGLANTGATLILLNKDGIEMDRVNGSDNWKIQGGEIIGNNTTKETAQRTSSGWITGAPTPRAINIGASDQTSGPSHIYLSATTQTTADTNTQTTKQPVLEVSSGSQITVDTGPANRTVLAGVPIVFKAQVFGSKKEPIENARVLWSFGDGATADSLNISHTYYYSGEYVLSFEVMSPYFYEGRIHVDVIMPELKLSTGGDAVSSFISIENEGNDEIDLTGVRIFAGEKSFVLPKIILDSKTKVTLPSEQTGLITPSNTLVTLSSPSGRSIPVVTEPPATPQPQEEVLTAEKNTTNEVIPSVKGEDLSIKPEVKSTSIAQEASVVNALISDTDTVDSSTPDLPEGNMWPWYVGTAFFATLAIVGIRLARKTDTPILPDGSSNITADDFDITEEK